MEEDGGWRRERCCERRDGDTREDTYTQGEGTKLQYYYIPIESAIIMIIRT